jgi:hypothetical protein|tara:strand:+ start:647 stop:925 length:279 start_codon:yes stop_codon:yes gene_type:complete
MNKLLIILLFLFLNVINCNRVRIYERIERNYVAEKVFNFLNENEINDCFSFREDYDHLLLKCLRDDEVFDVDITIKMGYDQRYDFKRISYVI